MMITWLATMKKNVVRLAFIFLLTLVFLYFFSKNVHWKDAVRYLSNVNLPLFILLIAITPIHLLSRAIRWMFLLRHEKKGVKFYNAFAGNAVGFTVTMIFPGRLGELIKPLYLARKENMKTGFVIGTVVVERIFDMFTMCFLLGVFLLAKPLYASSLKAGEGAFANLYRWGFVGLGFASFLALFSAALYIFKEKMLRVIAFFLKPFPQKISVKILELFREFSEGLRFFTSLRDVLIYALLSQMVWLSIIFYYWLFFISFRSPISYFFLFPYVFLTMVGASIPTPGMIGGFHAFSRLGLTTLFGMDPNMAWGLTIVVHLVQLVMTCLLGYAILWKEGVTLFQLKKLGENAQT